MPVATHLDWREIKEFGGLWTRDPWLGPANAASVMDNCYPQPAGGLRAFFRFTAGSMAGLNPTYVPLALMAGTQATQRLHLAYNPASGAVDLFSSSVGGAWTLRYTFTTDARLAEAIAATWTLYDALAGRDFAITVPGQPADVEDGLWLVNAAGTARTAMVADHPVRPMTVHQARLVTGGTSRRHAIQWTEPDGTSFPAANWLEIERYSGGSDQVSAIVPVPPSDLFVIKKSGITALVQGDLSSPTVRILNPMPDLATIGSAVRTPYGIAAFAPRAGVFLLNGDSWVRISESIAARLSLAPLSWDDQGQMLFHNNLLYCPGGYIHDFRTKAWFTLTVAEGQSKFWVRSPVSSGTNPGTITMLEWDGSTYSLWEGSPSEHEDATWPRNHTYTWKSLPLRDPSGSQQLEIQEVQVVAREVVISSTLTIVVSDLGESNSQSRTITMAVDADPQIYRAFFRVRDSALTVKVTATAPSSYEAPQIEAIRIGSRPRHRL